jgi:LysM repeat protein
MTKKTTATVIFILATMVLLAACQRSASKTAVTTPTKTNLPLVQTATGMSQVQMIGTTQMIQTMTAISSQGGMLTPLAFQSTPTVPFATASTPGTFTLVPPTGIPGSSTSTSSPLITPIVVVSTVTPGHPASYTLMSGEFPYCIARRFNVDQNELLALNGLTSSSASNLQPGYVLQIPQSGKTFEGERARNPHPTTYTVSSGNETVYSVACYFGDVDPSQIIAANNLTSPYTIHINQSLAIP